MKMENKEKNARQDDIYSKAVRAGKRTYFFDVKSTKANDYYLTITESTKRFNDDGTFRYEKHRIFLYKEDFEKFSTNLKDTMGYIVQEKGEEPIRSDNHNYNKNTRSENTHSPENPEASTVEDVPSNDFTDINFDDLGTENTSDELPEDTILTEIGDSKTSE